MVSSPATESLTQHTCQVLGAILGRGDTVGSTISSHPQGAALSELSLKPEAPGSLGGRRCSAGVGWGQGPAEQPLGPEKLNPEWDGTGSCARGGEKEVQVCTQP